MIHDILWENYGSWLLTEMGFKKRGYSSMIKQLHYTEFVWSIPLDENRAGDGMKYRAEYIKTFGGNLTDDQVKLLSEQPCSVLEMLVGLAIRCDAEYIGDPKSPRPDLLFWEMCCNLGLDEFKNRGFSHKKCEKQLLILHNWMGKNHKYNGEGTIFPVKNPANDHRKLEIWRQMMEYIYEKLNFE